MDDEILSKEAWPARGIGHYHAIDDGSWGYLVHYRLRGFVFETAAKPTPEEVLKRWGFYLQSSCQLSE